PADPARLTLGQRGDAATLEAVKKEFGLDNSKGMQLLLYLNDLSPIALLHLSKENREKYNYRTLINAGGDKGLVIKKPYLRRSYQSRKLVSQLLAEALPNTLVLAFTAFGIAMVAGLILGVIASLNPGSVLSQGVMVVSLLGVSVPSFFAAILLAWFFGFVLSGVTGLPMYGSLYEVDPFEGRYLALENLVLPAIALGIRPLAIITQLTRSSMLDVLSQDYVRTAVAKGLNPRIVLFRHALRNALNPVLTAASGWLASLLAGAFFVEYVFGWRGLGKITVEALVASDLPVVMGAVLLVAVIFVVINLLVDVLYAVLDPRIRLA
ncbi:MAG: ABC transporter permease, partial [Bacteroidota bacterium]|nr:ABC transporter permease [Bacteroidota bacterium]